MIIKKYDWALHMVSQHTVMPGTPSIEEMLTYPQAFIQMTSDHSTLHARFHCAHEHDANGAVIKPKPRGPKVKIEVIDD